MIRLLYAAMTILFMTSFAHGADDETVREFEPFPNQFYVFLLSDSIELEVDTTAYDGVEFPLYAGYVVVKDLTFTFVKKTSLPLEELVTVLDSAKALLSVDPDKPRNPRVPLSDNIRSGRLHTIIDRCFHDVFLVGFTGEPDENYTPVFEKTCVYRANPKKTCPGSEFDIAPEFLLIPTSNVVKERIANRRGPEEEKRVERYDPETKKWEDVGRY